MANIFAQFAQPVRSIADYQAEDDNRALRREQLAGAQRNNALADLTAQQTRQTMADTSRRQNALRQAAAAGQGMTPDAYASSLVANPDTMDAGVALQKHLADTGKVQAATAKDTLEVAETKRKALLGQVAALNSPEDALALIDHGVQSQTLPQPIAVALQNIVKTDPRWQLKLMLGIGDPSKMAELLKPHFQEVTNGKVKTFPDMNPITNPAGPAPITMTTTPGEDLTATTSTENNKRTVGATLAGQRSVAETARLGRVQADTHFNASQDSAKWDPTNQVWTNPKSQTVTPGTLPNGQPMPGKMPPIEYQKQATAFQNMDDALANYKTVLSGFGKTDMLSPSKRAEMGQAYQNALLQAKEIYQLGVLNGGDERILKGIINSPLDVTSALTPRDALLKQATDLQGILVRNNENMAKVHRQTPIPLKSTFGNAPGAAAHPAAAAKTGSGATVSKW